MIKPTLVDRFRSQSYMQKLESIEPKVKRLNGRTKRRFEQKEEEKRLAARSKTPATLLMSEAERERLSEGTFRVSKSWRP